MKGNHIHALFQFGKGSFKPALERDQKEKKKRSIIKFWRGVENKLNRKMTISCLIVKRDVT